MAKWAIRLSTFNISNDSRTTIKSQALTDFVADFNPNLMALAEEEFRHVTYVIDHQSWSLFIDGASNVNGTGLGLILKSPQGDTLACSVCCSFKATNNEMEYEALILGLRTAKDRMLSISTSTAICS